MLRTISLFATSVIFTAFTTVFAQTPGSPDPAPGSASEATSSAPAGNVPSVSEHKATKDTEEGKGKGKGKGHGKGHDKRGLDRADEAAGEHGKHGRDKARGNH